jgi:hypothetical protein
VRHQPRCVTKLTCHSEEASRKGRFRVNRGRKTCITSPDLSQN